MISIFKRGDAEVDRWADFPHLMAVGDNVPARGFKPSAGARVWRIVGRFVDYRKGEVTYAVELLA